MLLLIAACTAPSPDDSGAPPVDPNAYLAGTAALATVSGDSCPEIDGGKITLTSDGRERTVKVLLPDGDTAGKPLVFAWHPLGADADWLASALDLREYADTVDAVVFVPDSTGENTYEWGYVVETVADLTLYDDLRTCAYEQLAIDLGRVSSVGFSAGALWTSYLAVHRGDTLATILPFSGGADPIIAYEAPAGPLSALLNYGGDTDLYGGGIVDFTETTLSLADGLVGDDHFVVLCNHDGGHTIPPEGRDMMDAWLTRHTFGAASPFVSGDLSNFPDYCGVHE